MKAPEMGLLLSINIIHMSSLKEILKLSRDIIMKEPFYGVFLSTLNRVETTDPQVHTAGVRKVGINTEIAINPTNWDPLSYNIKYGILKHELLHICFFHLTMRCKYPDKELFNIAADIEINQYIESQYKDNTFLNYQDFDLTPFQGTDYYYEELKKMKGKNPLLDNLLSRLKSQSMQSGDQGERADHGSWKEVDNASEVEKKLMDKQTEHQMKDAKKMAKSRGTLPGKLNELLDSFDIIEPAVLDWKAFLRRFAGGSTKYYTKKTRRKQSLRFEDSPGLKIKQKNHLFVALDSSGSVSNKEFNEFLDQIHHIYKSGTEITIAHADSDVASVMPYKGKKIKERFGNGGTDFDPAIKYFNQHKAKYTSMVYFTDGECTPPSIKPQKPILWVISSKGKKLDSLPGIQIQIQKPNK